MEHYTKPLSMKLFSTWEGERTAPYSIPRTLTFKMLAVKLAKPFDTDIASLVVCASMSVGNFRRSLRTDEIFPDKNGFAETDYSFSFQYPHYLKREENILKLSLQRRKRYRNRTILGYKTVAVGHIDLALIMQCPCDEKLKLFAKGGGFTVASLHLNQVSSNPHESIRNHSGENSSSEEEIMFYQSDDDLDSEGEERTKKKSKFKDDLKLKKKFNALLKKMKINDDEHGEDPERDTEPLQDQYSATFSSMLGDLTDSARDSDSDSIGTLPKPHLRPYFMEREEDKEASSTDEGTCSRRTEDSSLRTDEMSRRTEESLPHRRSAVRTEDCHVPHRRSFTRTEDTVVHRRVSERSNSSLLNSLVSVVKPRVSATGKELCHQNTVDEEAVSPLRQSPASQGSLEEQRLGSLDDTDDHTMQEQLEAIFSKGETGPQVPEAIMLVCTQERAHSHHLIRAVFSTAACVYLHRAADAKVFISTLVNKMQKCITRHSHLPPVQLTLLGEFSPCNLILKPLMDALNNKSPDWINNFRLIFIPTDTDNPISRFVCTFDDTYIRLLDTLSTEADLDLLGAYQREAKEIVKLSVGRVLLSQLINKTDQDTKQIEVPFLHSVNMAFRKRSCVNCMQSVDSEEDLDKTCQVHETDIQVDYTAQHKRDTSSKQLTVKGVFRELGVTRQLGEQSINLHAQYREKKPKVALSRLKKQPDVLGVNTTVNTFTCMIRSTTGLSCNVQVDGVDYRNIISVYVWPLWSQNLNHIHLLTVFPLPPSP